jgi:8-oxo-dGTP diphosphatase
MPEVAGARPRPFIQVLEESKAEAYIAPVIFTRFFPLQAARLILRPISPEDRGGILALYSDWEVAKTLSRLPWPFTAEEADNFVTAADQHLRQGSEYTLALIERETSQFVGVCNLRLAAFGMEPRTNDRRLGILGYSVLRTQWRNGYASEAAACVTDFAFRKLGLCRLQATALRENAASRRVLEKLGFEVEKPNVLEIPQYGGPSRLADVFILPANRWSSTNRSGGDDADTGGLTNGFGPNQ